MKDHKIAKLESEIGILKLKLLTSTTEAHDLKKQLVRLSSKIKALQKKYEDARY